jgi:hypothetical protein
MARSLINLLCLTLNHCLAVNKHCERRAINQIAAPRRAMLPILIAHPSTDVIPSLVLKLALSLISSERLMVLLLQTPVETMARFEASKDDDPFCNARLLALEYADSSCSSAAMSKESVLVDSEQVHSIILEAQLRIEKYDVQEYTLPGPDGTPAGSVCIYKPQAFVKEQVDGSNDLFEELQREDFKLTRNPTRKKDSV